MLTLKRIGIVGVSVLFIIALSVVAGCAADNAEPLADDAQTEWVVGTVLNISENEILIDVTSDSTGNLTGELRVSIGEIDSSIVKDASVGSTVEVVFSGVMGMSMPPFISALELSVSK